VLVSPFSPINPALDHLADLALWEAELAADQAVMVRRWPGGWNRCRIRVIRGAVSIAWSWFWC
jgi:hypothetical protein